jgi:MFS family permease
MIRRLLAAQTVSPLGDAMTTTALILHVQAVEGTGTAVGLLLLATSLPPIVSPLAGVVADRVERRSLLVISQVTQGLVIGIAALTLPPLPVLFALVLVSAAGATVFEPALASGVPALIDDDELPKANALLTIASESGTIVGPVLAGLLFPLISAQGVLALDALTFVAAAVVLLGLPRLEPEPQLGQRMSMAAWGVFASLPTTA